MTPFEEEDEEEGENYLKRNVFLMFLLSQMNHAACADAGNEEGSFIKIKI